MQIDCPLSRTFVRSLLIAGLLWCAIGVSRAEVGYETLLREADRIRTSDTQRFQRILAELDRTADTATPAQRMRVRLMHAHKSFVTGDTAAAIRELEALRHIETDADLRFRAGAMLANAYASNREFRKALTILEETILLVGRVKDRDTRDHGLLAAAIVYNLVGQYDLGRDYAEKVLSENATSRNSCIAGGQRLEALQQLRIAGKDDEAWLIAIARCESAKEPIITGFARIYLARKWYAEGRNKAAIALLKTHLLEVEATGYPYLIAEVKSLLAEFHLAAGDLTASKQYAHAALRYGAGVEVAVPLVRSHQVLYQIAERRHDPVAALAHYRDYARADKMNLDDVQAREFAYQLVRHEMLQKTQKIALLNGQNQLLQLQQRIDNQSAQNTRLMLLMLALLVALIGYWAYKVKRVQQSLRRFAETDALTGISNRHHFTQQAGRALARSAAEGEACALIMFDLDHFKVINDSYGHDIGDWVLKQVARTCEGLCRRIDQFGRLGGEEFAILLRGIDLQSATRLAEDCRVRLTQIDSRESGHAFVVTASFGVTATSLSGYNLTKLLSHADQMLYSSKRAGRNCVHAFTGDAYNPPQLHVVPRGDASMPNGGGERLPDEPQEKRDI